MTRRSCHFAKIHIKLSYGIRPLDRIYYVFWDVDEETDKDLDIDGEAYAELIDVCFRYAKVFAVTYSLKGFRDDQLMEKSVFQYFVAKKAILNGQIRCFFKCCRATKQYLVKSYPCLFSWYWNEKQHGYLPENLTFYRSDGSAFFASETHEGQCFLYPRKEEDFSSVLKSEGWSPGITGGARLPCCMKSSWLDPQPNNFPEST